MDEAEQRNEPHRVARHSMFEDAMALGYGTFMCSLGVVVMTHLGFVTGQTAGIAIVVSYATGWSFGPVFFVINLPFYLLAWQRMGPLFTLKTFAAVALVTLFMAFLPPLVTFERINPVLGAVMVGTLSGAGLLALFRHGASLGGIGVLALFLQDKTGFRAGWTQLIADAMIFSAAFFVIDAALVAYSLMGAVVLNVVIGFNHRRDRYIAT